MTEASETTSRPSIIDRMKDAALTELRERQDERNRVADIVLGHLHRAGNRHVTDVIKLGDDYLVEVTHRDEATWTTVVNGRKDNWHHERQEDAILHLIARRFDDNSNTSMHAVFYAGRVLGIPTSGDA